MCGDRPFGGASSAALHAWWEAWGTGPLSSVAGGGDRPLEGVGAARDNFETILRHL